MAVALLQESFIQRQEVVIEGYCRAITKCKIPLMMIKVILSYVNQRFHWKFKGDTLKSLLSPRKDVIAMRTRIFTFRDIKLSFVLYPNSNSSKSNAMEFGLTVMGMPENIDFVVISVRFLNKETSIFRAFTAKYTMDKPDWAIRSILSNANWTEINFFAHWEILRIQPKETSKCSNLLYHKSGLKMSRKVHYEWNLSAKLVEMIKTDFKDCAKQKFYNSPYFDHENWMMVLYERQRGSKDYFFGFILYQFPHGEVREITFKYAVTVTRNGQEIWSSEKSATWNMDNIQQATGKTLRFTDENMDMANTESLCAVIDIEVERIMGSDGEIAQEKWLEYGIIGNDG